MTRPSRRVADYAPSTLNFSAELVLAAAVEEAVALLRAPMPMPGMSDLLDHFGVPGTACRPRKAEDVVHVLYDAANAADLILGRAR
jgi:hypothetical protein